jgi:hypothetical protein
LFLRRKRLMSAEHDKNPSGFRFTKRYTLDVRVPLSDDDSEMKHSWRNIPIPPGPPEEGWQVLDSSHDRRTTWARVVRDYWGTTRLAAAGRVIARVLHIKAPDKPEG